MTKKLNMINSVLNYFSFKKTKKKITGEICDLMIWSHRTITVTQFVHVLEHLQRAIDEDEQNPQTAG
jgi:hypothetical protein